MCSANNCDFVTEYIKFQKVLYSAAKRKGFVPQNGSEVFVRHVPYQDSEIDLLKFFQTIGDIFQIRLMMNENGLTNRGFAYVTYFSASDARKAVETLNEVPYKKTYFLSIELSLNNCRLFIGGIPTYKRKDQVWQELYCKGVKNIIDVIMYRSYSDRSENRGFVFVEFKTHEEAAHFRAKYARSLKLWDCQVVVDWSIPVPQVEDSVMTEVKIIYIRNLDVCQTREELQATVLNFTPKSTIEKVYKFKNYAFVHLLTREYAEHLLKCLKDYYKDKPIEVEWAKPANKFTSQDYRHSKVSSLSASKFCARKYSPKAQNSSSPCYCSHLTGNPQIAQGFQPKPTAFEDIRCRQTYFHWPTVAPEVAVLQAQNPSTSTNTKDHPCQVNIVAGCASPRESFYRELTAGVALSPTSSMDLVSFSPRSRRLPQVRNMDGLFDDSSQTSSMDLLSFSPRSQRLPQVRNMDGLFDDSSQTSSMDLLSFSPRSQSIELSSLSSIDDTSPSDLDILLSNISMDDLEETAAAYHLNPTPVKNSHCNQTNVFPSSASRLPAFISISDMGVIPRDIPADNLQDIIGDILD